ncbi:MAG: PTS sugar transporter subunit IIA [Phycisphaerae bacterium]|jgi:mannitol/fructose-specific phosphotransferase system IIA component (Ntr-type)|nr:PTS sugar transporter subunit IIA [Phycisphaerae bacterium]MCZ2398372.1 PTS sugar transporter subunit IIA [Phycisphaerae bacterium]NUQ48850.1 PTS sugar transporter subunit IIA [Phycisphaerae bacterium]
MDLSSILTLDRIRVPLVSGEKTGIITELIDLLAERGALRNRDAVLEAVLKREAERTTGIGYGLAIPHGKSDGCTQLAVAAGKPAAPVDFQSLDRRPVTFVVLLVSPPDQTGPHIQALAKVSRLMNIEEFRKRVDLARTPEELFDAIRATEAGEHTPR